MHALICADCSIVIEQQSSQVVLPMSEELTAPARGES
jgi:hypothetical protein